MAHRVLRIAIRFLIVCRQRVSSVLGEVWSLRPRSRLKLLAFVTWTVCVFAQRVPAATVTVVPRVVSALDPVSFEEVPLAPGVLPGTIIPPQDGEFTYLVEFYVRVSDLAGPPEELGFAIVVFDLLLDGGSRNSSFPGWHSADGPRAYVDPDGPGPSPRVAKWNCVDCPTSQLDLRQLVVGVAPHGFGELGVDPRWSIGQGPFPNNEPGEYMGFLFADWDGTSLGVLSVDVTDFALYDDQLVQFRADGTEIGGQVLFGVPEPTAGTLAVVATLMGAVLSFSRSHGPQRYTKSVLSLNR